MPDTSRSRRLPAVLLALALALVATPAQAATLVEVSARVTGELAPSQPLAGVEVAFFRWDPQGDTWLEDVTTSTGKDGRFSVLLEEGITYTAHLVPLGDTYPWQWLGGVADRPAGPSAADWQVTTFVAGDGGLTDLVRLLTSHAHAVAGFVEGDEDGEAPSGWVELFTTDEPGTSLQDTAIAPDGGFVLTGLRAGRSYTVRVTASGYLPTYLGSTTQPELAASFPATAGALPPVTLRRGAGVTGLVRFQGAPAAGVHVKPLRWDPLGRRWLAPAHLEGQPTDTAADGSWSLTLEPQALYTLHLDTSDAAGLPPSQYLGGGTAPPSPTTAGATFTPGQAGTVLDVDLAAPAPAAPPPPAPPSPAPPAQPAASTTTLSLSRTSAPYGAKVTATVTVRAATGSPGGPVTLRLDGKTLTTARPTVSGRTATLRVTLPRTLKVGRHTLVASVAATGTVRASTSAPATLKVTKAPVRLTVKGPARWKLAAGKRPTVKVTVRGTKGGPKPGGKVTVAFGRTKVTATLRSGKATLRGPRLTGRRSVAVTVRYTPKAKTYAKATAKRTLRVR